MKNINSKILVFTIIIILAIVFIVGFIFKLMSLKSKNNLNSNISNPLVEYESLEKLQLEFDYHISIPNYIPANYSDAKYFTVLEKIAELIYYDNDNKICFRIRKNEEGDISGENGPFIFEYEEDGIVFKGYMSEDLVNVLIWSDEQYDYSISSNLGLAKDEMLKIKNSIQ